MAIVLAPAARVTVDPRYAGPPGLANGGYAAGLIAAAAGMGAEAEVVLRHPIPLGAEVTVGDGEARIAAELVARVRPADLAGLVPVRVDARTAGFARAGFPFERHYFPGCYVCGHRHPGGLGIHPGLTPSGQAVASTLIAPAGVGPATVWAALDCPGGWAAYLQQPAADPRPLVLGTLAARIDRLPVPGERLVVTGWLLDDDGRRTTVGSVLLDAAGDALAVARAVWVRLTEQQRAAFAAQVAA